MQPLAPLRHLYPVTAIDMPVRLSAADSGRAGGFLWNIDRKRIFPVARLLLFS
jgi:hypothetical protein